MKANALTKLASRPTGNHREVAARLVAENVEGREKYEGDVFTTSGLQFRFQDPSKHQDCFALEQ